MHEWSICEDITYANGHGEVMPTPTPMFIRNDNQQQQRVRIQSRGGHGQGYVNTIASIVLSSCSDVVGTLFGAVRYWFEAFANGKVLYSMRQCLACEGGAGRW